MRPRLPSSAGHGGAAPGSACPKEGAEDEGGAPWPPSALMLLEPSSVAERLHWVPSSALWQLCDLELVAAPL